MVALVETILAVLASVAVAGMAAVVTLVARSRRPAAAPHGAPIGPPLPAAA